MKTSPKLHIIIAQFKELASPINNSKPKVSTQWREEKEDGEGGQRERDRDYLSSFPGSCVLTWAWELQLCLGTGKSERERERGKATQCISEGQLLSEEMALSLCDPLKKCVQCPHNCPFKARSGELESAAWPLGFWLARLCLESAGAADVHHRGCLGASGIGWWKEAQGREDAS